MVKAKQQKPSKKQPQIKKQEKQADISQFRSQLDALGLRIVEVTADGNCFFRALADQLEGNQEEHEKYRGMVVRHLMETAACLRIGILPFVGDNDVHMDDILLCECKCQVFVNCWLNSQHFHDNRDTFEPFIEDDVPFDEYCQSMEKDGTWAGHMELQAASLVTHCNICIHRNMSPRWYIRNFDDCRARMIHLSYHDGEHYNSVRLKDDPCDGPARSIIIKADADLSATSNQAKVKGSISYGRAGQEIIQPGSVKLVMAGTGCENAEKVEQTLVQVDGDVDAAIEFLIAEQGMDECPIENSKSPPCQAETSCGGDGKVNHEQHKEDKVKKTTSVSLNNSSRKTNNESILQPNDKKIPRNKVCPCGSKKKYKACCGSVSGKQSAKFVIEQAADTRKGRKERKLVKKGVRGKAEAACETEHDGEPPDMGALCI